ncbi:MAG: GntR family transcriptional regulator [Akkermansiaceae bacterium]|nr:GntR family transcriptional regulator [Verrucomicrobiales bacterium]
MAIIGRRNTLSIERASAPGLYLNGGELGEILLPGRYIPEDLAPGMKMDVFIYLDSEDRLVATTEIPSVMVGEFGYLKVISIHPRVGAFLDWGLPKDLLLPFREQDGPVHVGDWVIAYVGLDARTNRIVASTRLHRYLDKGATAYRTGQPVKFLITSRTPLGYNAIVENAHRGLLYHDKLAAPLEIGQTLKGFIRTIRPSGKLDLSLDASGYKRVAPLKDRIIEALEGNGGRIAFDDDSSPEAIRDMFQCSKKAFKQALGALYKSRRIRFCNPGIQLLDNSEFSPGEDR